MTQYVVVLKFDSDDLYAPDVQAIKQSLKAILENDDIFYHGADLLSLRFEEQPPEDNSLNQHSKLSFIPSCADCYKQRESDNIFQPMQFEVVSFPVLAERWECPSCGSQVWIPLEAKSEIPTMTALALF